MKLTLISLFLASIFAFNVNAELPVAEVVKIRGDVKLGAWKLKKGDVIKDEGILVVGPKSFVKIEIKKWNNSLVLGPNSKMKFALWKKAKKKYSFIKGACRWISKKGKKGKGVLHTRRASMGVRGTDFLVIVNDLLDESEIVVLDGAVEFTNSQDKNDKALIKKGQWGGVGGRYGEKIGKVLDLPKNVLDNFSKKLDH